MSAEVGKTASRIKSLLVGWDLQQAFTQLYRLPKTLAKCEDVSRRDLEYYFPLVCARRSRTRP